MANQDLSRFILDTNPEKFQAEYQPTLDSQGNPATPPPGCDIPPFINPLINPQEPPPPEINKDCLLPFIPIPVVPQPYIDISIPGIACPDGIEFQSRIIVKNGNEAPKTFITQVTPIGSCGYDFETTLDFNIIVPCAETGITVNATGIKVTIHDPNPGSQNPQGPQTLVPTIVNSKDSCTLSLNGNLDIWLPQFVGFPCPEGFSIDDKEFYVEIDDPNSCGTKKHEFKARRGGAAEIPPAIILAGSKGSIGVSSNDGMSFARVGSLSNTITYYGATNSTIAAVVVGVNDVGGLKAYYARAFNPSGTWTMAELVGYPSRLRAVTSGCERLVAVGDLLGGGSFILWAEDSQEQEAVVWTQASTTGISQHTNLNGIAFGCSNKFVAVGAQGTVIISTDAGLTWKTKVLPDSSYYTFYGVANGGGKFVVVGGSAGAGVIYFTQDCAKTWKKAENIGPSSAFRCVTYDDSNFLAITESGSAFISKDGEHWSPTQNVMAGVSTYSVTGNGNKLFVAGSSLNYGHRWNTETGSGWSSVTVAAGNNAAIYYAAAYRPGNRAGNNNCSFGIYPPLKLKLPYVPCADGMTVSVEAQAAKPEDTSFNINATQLDENGTPQTSQAGSGLTLYFTGDSCNPILKGSIVFPAGGSGGPTTPQQCLVPRWG